MKDIIIKSNKIKSELITLLICFIISFISNIGAIFFYESPIEEVFTSLFYVILFAIFLYIMWSVIHLIITSTLRFIKK
jgi:hypothetical protein